MREGRSVDTPAYVQEKAGKAASKSAASGAHGRTKRPVAHGALVTALTDCTTTGTEVTEDWHNFIDT